MTLPGLSIDLETGSPLYVVQPGQEEKLAFQIKNTTGASKAVKLSVEIESFDGSKQNQSAIVQVPATGMGTWKIPRALIGKLGIKYVTATLEADGRAAPPIQYSFSYMEPSGPLALQPGDFIFGMAYGAGPDETKPLAALASSLIGVTTVRTNPRWPLIQKTPGQFDWERSEERRRVNASQGMETQWLVSGTPEWAVDPTNLKDEGGSHGKPPSPQAWREFIGAMARKYNDKPRYWEIWNEPDIGFFRGTNEQHLEMQRIAYEEIKKADPRQIVMSGSFASTQHRDSKPGLLEAALRQGNFEVLAYHQHGDFEKFRREVDDNVRPIMKRTGRASMPFYFTETAIDTRRGEQFQAETLLKKLTFAWSRGAIGYTWFHLNLRDEAYDRSIPTPLATGYGVFLGQSAQGGLSGLQHAHQVVARQEVRPAVCVVGRSVGVYVRGRWGTHRGGLERRHGRVGFAVGGGHRRDAGRERGLDGQRQPTAGHRHARFVAGRKPAALPGAQRSHDEAELWRFADRSAATLLHGAEANHARGGSAHQPLR